MLVASAAEEEEYHSHPLDSLPDQPVLLAPGAGCSGCSGFNLIS